jgi:hypothetical protein
MGIVAFCLSIGRSIAFKIPLYLCVIVNVSQSGLIREGVNMDISKVKEHMPVYVEGPGGLQGASDIHIGNIDSIEGNKYLKLSKLSSPDGEHHWFPMEWVRAVDERAVYLNKTIDEAMEELLDKQPS